MSLLAMAVVILLIILDLFTKIRITGKYPVGLLLIFAPHFVLLHLILTGRTAFLYYPCLVLSIYTLIRLGIYPIGRHRTASTRLNFLYSGGRLLNLSIYMTVVQVVFYPLVLHYRDIPVRLLIWDIIATTLIISLMAFNGMLRVIFTSRWLNVVKRLLCFFFILVAPVNLFIMFYLRHIAAKEYDYFEYKLNDMPRKVKNQICHTKYPILLVHGVGFRDTRYFNYWGRIPKHLRAMGAEIYYGNQEGFATIDDNAELLHNRVMEILKETGAERINIIAHSKGGLDCRQMIYTYDMGQYIASLTTMGTPHHGVHFADVLLARIPRGIVGMIANMFNSTFRKYGDTHPDFQMAVYMLTEEYAEKFNKRVTDSPQVYYQSYSSVMRGAFSDPILTVPYIISRMVGSGANDGLVPEPSAHWGRYRGCITTGRMHGVSHGDLIDLKREDFRGFDMFDKYTEIVSELKEMGY